MARLLLLFCSLLLLLSCSGSKKGSLSDTSLTVLDLSGDFPFRRVDIHDIADVEYIPLETNEHSLLTKSCGHFFISDDYIITADLLGGNLFFFDRSGKHLRTVNRKGQGNEEYTTATLIVDFDAKECFIHDISKKKIVVYDFKGSYKRSLPLPPRGFRLWFYNYNKDFLLTYNRDFDYVTQKHTDEHPYYLVSKQDGTMHSLNLTIKDRIGPNVHLALVKSGRASYWDRTAFQINPILVNGTDVLIADFTLDTLYLSNDEKLIPVALRTPSVRATTPPVILNPLIYTDSLLCFEIMPFYYNPSNPFEATEKSRQLACDRTTGKIEEVEFYNSDILVHKRCHISMKSINRGGSLKDISLARVEPSSLLERYEAGELKGRLKEIAPKLKVDDNIVLILCKLK